MHLRFHIGRDRRLGRAIAQARAGPGLALGRELAGGEPAEPLPELSRRVAVDLPVERGLERRRRDLELHRLVILEDELAVEIARLGGPARRLLLVRLRELLPQRQRAAELLLGALRLPVGEVGAAGAGLGLDDARA